jgi:hypothetical protein
MVYLAACTKNLAAEKLAAVKRRRAAESLSVGDKVLIRTKHFKLLKGLKLKLAPRYLGPFLVLEVMGPNRLSYRVELPPPVHRKHDAFHVSALKTYHGDGIYPPPDLRRVAEEEFTVDFISDISVSKALGLQARIANIWFIGLEAVRGGNL